jgi:MMPL family
VITVALLVLIGSTVFGVPVTSRLSAGGLTDPNAQSSRATALLARTFGQGDMPMLITVSSPKGVNSSAARAAGSDIVRALQQSPAVATVTSPWTAAPPASAPLISKDGKTGLIVVGITGGENGAPKNVEALTNEVVHDRHGVTVRAGGEAATRLQIVLQTEKEDLKVMEAVAIPLSFLVLVWVFGGLVAAALPLAVGGIAIFGSMAALRAISLATDVSILALNLSVAMGLAVAIDYTLLMLSRFRDERAAGVGRDDALVRTMVAAGRNRAPRVRHHRASGPAALFTFDLTTRLRYDILTPRGPVDLRLASCAGHWPMRPWPVAAEIWGEVFTEPQRVRIGGRRVGVSMRWRSGREHKGLDNDNRRNTELSNKTVSAANKERTGLACWSTEVIDRLRHVRGIT